MGDEKFQWTVQLDFHVRNIMTELLRLVARLQAMRRTVRLFWFLPRDASAERGDATVSCLSVCLSVCNVQVP